MIQQFNEIQFDKLCQLICEDKRTLIVYHIRSDADAVGSAFALKELLRVMGIQSYCACSDEIPERLQFLTDGVQWSVLLDDELYMDFERVISVDSASPSQLGELFGKLHKNIDIMIDHHATGTPYADYYIEPDAAATGEIIYAIAKRLCEMGEIEAIPPRVVNCVYAAISSDTGGFRFANTTPQTLEIAAELMEQGVDATELNRLLFDTKPLVQIKAEGVAIERLKTCDDGSIAYTSFPYSAKVELGALDEHLGTLIDIPRSVAGAEIAFVVKQESENGEFRVSMRSASEFDVAKVCARFGGGGHKRAAGCSVTAKSIEDAEEKIIYEIMRIKRL